MAGYAEIRDFGMISKGGFFSHNRYNWIMNVIVVIKFRSWNDRYIIHLITIYYTLFLTSNILLAELISSCCITPPMIRLLIMQPLVEFSWYVSKFANEANRDLLVTQQSQKLWESIHGEWILACLIRKKNTTYILNYITKYFQVFCYDVQKLWLRIIKVSV